MYRRIACSDVLSLISSSSSSSFTVATTPPSPCTWSCLASRMRHFSQKISKHAMSIFESASSLPRLT